MNTDELSGMLRTLPPAMHGPADRFDAVAQRANRRARATTAAIVGVATAAVVAVATAALGGTTPTTQPDSGHIATEPPTPSETLRYEPSGPPLPGETTVTDLNDPVAATGTSTVALGPRPRGATAANVSVVCLTAGRICTPTEHQSGVTPRQAKARSRTPEVRTTT
jgi:hypothetical protein